jgi:hypothetical protein
MDAMHIDLPTLVATLLTSEVSIGSILMAGILVTGASVTVAVWLIR